MPRLTRRTAAGSAVLAIGFILAACGGGAGSGTDSASASADAGQASDGGSGAEAGLCDAIGAELAEAALGQAAAAMSDWLLGVA